MKPDWTIANQFEKYLNLVSLDKRKMAPNQLIEMRRIFYGAWGQVLVLLRDELAALPEDEGVEMLELYLKEIADFFLKEQSRSQ